MLLQSPIDPYLVPEDVHAQHKQPASGSAMLTLMVSAILAALHAFNTYYLLWVKAAGMERALDYDRTPLMIFLLMHIVLVIAAWLFAIIHRAGEQTDQRFDLVLVFSTLTMGVLGALGTVVAILFFGIFNRYALDFAEWFASIFPRSTPSLPEIINENIVTGRDETAKSYSVIPFLDVMTIGSEEQKREALSRMTTNFHPIFAPAFHKALADDMNAIRVQAATSIAKIENHFLERSIFIDQLQRKHPKDMPILLALARHYDNYAYTGILDPEREEANRARALDAYTTYLKSHPDNVEVRLYVGRLLIRSGRTEQAADWLRQSIDAGFSAPQMATWYMECLFTLGRYDELRQFATRFRHSQGQQLQPQLAEAIQLWTAEPREIA